MPEFALLFRPTRPIAANELPPRNNAAREWALALRAEGTLATASPLEAEGAIITPEGVTRGTRDVAAVLVIRAPDLDAAVALAKGHPSLAYGTEVEVRLVKPVPPA